MGASVRHDDAVREWTYDRKVPRRQARQGVDEGTRRGWTITSMKRDWNKVFAFEP